MNEGITVTMALVDFIPVALFFAGAVVLLCDLYHRLVKGAYCLLAAGSIMAFTGDLFKAGWKLLYALNVCDYVLLDHAFFPMQGPGFLLFFIGLCGLFYKPRAGKTGVLAARKKNRLAVVLFIASFVFMLGMGYLGAKFDDSSGMHWMAQATNTVSMAAFLMGVLSVRRTGYTV